MIATKSRPKTERSEALSNPFKIPRGEKLRREVVAVFREQRTAILRYLKTGKKDQAPNPPPLHWPAWDDFGLGALDISQRMTPILKAIWDDAGQKFAPRVGLDPDEWSVVNPHTERMIEEAALAFSESMNQTTSLALDDALARTRATLVEGVVKKGETLEQLTRRINVIFDGAEKHRARRIAQTETSRAVHAAQEQSAIESGVVTGWEWLASGDACPLCVAVRGRAPTVSWGNHSPSSGTTRCTRRSSSLRFTPIRCNCTVLEVLDTDPQPTWHDTLHQPAEATDEEADRFGREANARMEEILGTKPKPKKPKPQVKPKPAAKPKPKPLKPVPTAPMVPTALVAPLPYTLDLMGTFSDVDVVMMRKAIESIPEPALRTIQKYGGRFVFAEKYADFDPINAKDMPRGWDPGMTWEHTDGCYNTSEKVALACRTKRIGTDDPPRYFESYRREGVIRHEAGHAFDDALVGAYGGASRDKVFRAAYDKDIASIPADVKATYEFQYYLQSAHVGPREVFAETFWPALWRRGRESDPQPFPEMCRADSRLVPKGVAVTVYLTHDRGFVLLRAYGEKDGIIGDLVTELRPGDEAFGRTFDEWNALPTGPYQTN